MSGINHVFNSIEKGKPLWAGTVTLNLRVRIPLCLVVKKEYDFDKQGRGRSLQGKRATHGKSTEGR